MRPAEQASASGVETDELLALAKAALPGEWEAEYDEGRHTVTMYQAGDSRGNFESHREWKCEHGLYDDEDTPEARGQWEEAHATACYLAACSPERIIAILTELTALRARFEAAERGTAAMRRAGDNLVRATSPGEDERFRAQARREWFAALALTPSPTPTRTEP